MDVKKLTALLEPYLPQTKQLLSLIAVISLALAIPLTVYLSQQRQEIRQRAQITQGETINWKTHMESITENSIKSPEEILEISLSYQSESTQPITIENVKRKMGFLPKYRPENNEYILEVHDNRKSLLYSQPFSIPKLADQPPPLNREDIARRTRIPEVKNFSLTIPSYPTNYSIRILNPRHEIIATKIIVDIQTIKNLPNFRSVKGNNIRQEKKGSYNLKKLFMRDSYAETPDNGYLDITFIGDGYRTSSDLEVFHRDVDRFVTHLLSYEPFKSRASQLFFHYVDNTNSLNCSYSGRLLTCDISKVIEEINNSAAPHDTVVVIVNNTTYGGAGYLSGNIAVAYNGSSGPQVFVHELGHSFGGLLDEYVYNFSYDGPINNAVNKNCYLGNPPASNWQQLVAPGDYAQGCSYRNWYRSSPSSTMLDLSPYFNAISQAELNKNLDYFAGIYADSQTPSSAITLPKSGDTVSGKNFTVTTSVSDNNGLSRVELWKDNTLYKTAYLPPFNFSWLTTREGNGNHTLQVKAYDTANNTGVSTPVLVAVNNPKDTTPPSVSIISPTNNAKIDAAATGYTWIDVSANDDIDLVRIDIYVDYVLLKSAEPDPYYGYAYAFWDITAYTPNSTHIIQAKAYDSTGNVGVSTPISVIIASPVSTPSFTPTPTSFKTILGAYIDDKDIIKKIPGQAMTVEAEDGSYKATTTDSPNWSFSNLAPKGYWFYITQVPGYTTYVSVCPNCNSPRYSFDKNDKFFMQIPPNYYYGVFVRFIPIPTPTITPTLTPTPTFTPTPTPFLIQLKTCTQCKAEGKKYLCTDLLKGNRYCANSTTDIPNTRCSLCL